MYSGMHIDELFEFFDKNSKAIHKDVNSIHKNEDCFMKGCTTPEKRLRYHRCVGCEIIDRLSINPNFADKKEIEIVNGKYAGSKLLIRVFNANFSPYELVSFDKSYVYSSFQKNIKIERIKISKVLSNKNRFIHYALVSSLLMHNTYVWIYCCRNKTCIFDFVPDMGYGGLNKLSKNAIYTKSVSPIAQDKSLNMFSHKTILSVLKQLVINLHSLKKYEFIHGEPFISYLGFSSDKNEKRYCDKTFFFDLKLYLNPSFYSSIVYNEIKYISHRNVHVSYPIQNFDIKIGNNTKNMKNLNIPYLENYERSLYFLIGNKHETYLDMLRAGYNIFADTFDTVMFVLSLLTNESFYYSFIQTNEFKILDELFLEKVDFDKVRKCKTFNELYLIVKNYHILVDACDFLLKKLN